MVRRSLESLALIHNGRAQAKFSNRVSIGRRVVSEDVQSSSLHGSHGSLGSHTDDLDPIVGAEVSTKRCSG
jgi:hypothetical protein